CRPHFRRVLDLHALIDVDRDIRDVEDRESEKGRDQTELDRGDATLIRTKPARNAHQAAEFFCVMRELHCLVPQRTSCALLGRFPVGIDKPCAAHPPVSRMLPVPLINTLSTTIAKHDWPLLALFTAPLKVTLECGR